MKFIFIDIDGTLYDHKTNQVLPSSLEAIDKTRKKGNKVFICTGRSISEAKKFLNFDVDGFVFSAGAVAYAEKIKLYKNPINVDEIKGVMNTLDNLGLGYCLDGDAGAYFNDYGYEFIRKYFNEDDEAIAELKIQEDGFYRLGHWDDRDLITKLCVYGKNIDEVSKVDFLSEKFDITFTLNNEEKEMFCKEITTKGQNKSTGIQKILEYYNGSFADSVGIGDSDNDLEMLRDCGLGIAMGNASENAKKAADYITDDMSSDGIYNAFAKFGLL